ncbi:MULTISPECIES: UTP--glucose-1-phosphate uridylyltransferase GalU [Metabacillus]|jgi:UTP--glucose-1-phosphate uridylyltransferase|uniref:UTP--glucose-1-phosphate uridylyltransferase n=3 Tax=Metabacillus TaxID=2675233 RepID=A0A179SVF6_9BACI|nr:MULTISPECIES: UTP--glucose-1-phosphate uridylyltransferase GalU [Metabacillus]OAS85786.1 UTP--glucose-1-phosphate uridylyltransferase [Metabacillus litoralis]QNF27226.1 UTP--glucose-1-phosphate uridylyltransferase GalU [Metabacillus sp. KUDC1714]
MQRVKKAVIPAAGLGTRFLPATKAQPKEMLPIVDKPTIQYIIEEAVQSGIEDILIVTGRGKRAIEDHFDKSYELEENLAQKEKWELLEQVRSISELANIHYIRQKEPKGLGHAIYCARRFIGDDPFAVMLGDDVVQSVDKPCLQQLIDVHSDSGSSVVGVQKVIHKDVSKYGIIGYKEKMDNSIYRVNSFVEKPNPLEAPSDIAIMGRYILTPTILDILENQPPGSGGEIQLTDSLNTLLTTNEVLAYEFSGKRYDVGDKLGFIKATLDFGLQRPELREDLIRYIMELDEVNNS